MINSFKRVSSELFLKSNELKELFLGPVSEALREQLFLFFVFLQRKLSWFLILGDSGFLFASAVASLEVLLFNFLLLLLVLFILQ